ncbi:MAG: crotonase/enoyl-CoA hydratase family protein [Alphaproteobacteria bacterium]|nr:crotonase/enoyl-CoA hydratase family protein [Alphaproteobacteria bacterium]MCB9691893.1 crotonase/enoyl-CoA hydratase family protein [Alphaproteobacteria bacterium]
MTLRTATHGSTWVVTIDRPERRNAVDRATAEALEAAFATFEEREDLAVAVLTGAGGTFCAGADLKAVAEGRPEAMNRIALDGPGPMGPTRRVPSKPVIAAIEGYAVAGGLELALLADLRVAAEDAVLGVFCRRFGVPLIDGGTVRLPRLIGRSRALDLILTGRAVDAAEALSMGLVNRVVPAATALDAALELAASLARLPQAALRNDRMSVYEQEDLDLQAALLNEMHRGLATLGSGETVAGAQRFAGGAGRGGVSE